MTEDNESTKVGELLNQAGLVTTHDISEVMVISKRMGVPFGRVLISSGCITEIQLRCAIDAQSLIRDGLVDQKTAIKALKICFTDKVVFQHALQRLNWRPQAAETNRIGELLVEAGVVTVPQLDEALEACYDSGMPLGKTLAVQGVMPAQCLPVIMHVQEQIRQSKMSRQDAIQELRTAITMFRQAERSKSDDFDGLPASFAEKSARQSRNSLRNLKSTKEATKTSSASHPSVVANSEAIPESIRSLFSSTTKERDEIASDLSGQAEEAEPTKPSSRQAAKPAPVPLKKASSSRTTGSRSARNSQTTANVKADKEKEKEKAAATRSPFDDPFAASEPPTLSDLTALAHFCTAAQIHSALDKALKHPIFAGKLLIMMKLIDQDQLVALTRCHSLIMDKSITTEQAIFALNNYRNGYGTIEDCLHQVGMDLE